MDVENEPSAPVTPERLRELMHMSPDDLKTRAWELLGLSAEQQAIVEGSAWARHVMRLDAFKNAISLLIAARQMYAIGYVELQQQLEAIQEGGQELPHLTQDILIQSAMYTASKPFSEHTFMQNLTSTVLPALAAVIDRHSEKDEQEERRLRAEYERQQATRAVPMPCRVDVDDERPELTRERSVTLTGNANACRLYVHRTLDLIAKATPAFTVLWLDDRVEPSRGDDAQVFRVPADVWRGCANSADSFAQMLSRYLTQLASRGREAPHRLDLVICNNLSMTFSAGYRGRDAGANAGDGHKRIWQWCQKHSAGLLGFVPKVTNVDDSDPDTKDPALEQLRTFSRLRPLRLRRVDDVADDSAKLRLLVGLSGDELMTTVRELNEFSALHLA